MVTKIYVYKNLSHIVKKVLIQISNLKAFCNRHVKPYKAGSAKQRLYLENEEPFCSVLAGSDHLVRRTEKLGLGLGKEEGGCNGGWEREEEVTMGYVGWGRGSFLSFIKIQTANHFISGPGKYKELNMTAGLKIFSLLRD